MDRYIKIRKFTDLGLDNFQDIIVDRRNKGTRTIEYRDLVEDKSSADLDEALEIEPSRQFKDRLELAEYIYSILGEERFQKWKFDIHLWSWLAALYFEQFTKDGTSKLEHYILSTGGGMWEQGQKNSLIYRHCVWGPVFVLSHPNLNSFKEFIILGVKGPGKGIATMGESIEQILSKPKTIRSRAIINTIVKLYMDKNTKLAKTGFASEPKKCGKDRKSSVGVGGIRRLNLVIPRLRLTYEIDQLTTEQIISLCGIEFSTSKWNL